MHSLATPHDTQHRVQVEVHESMATWCEAVKYAVWTRDRAKAGRCNWNVATIAERSKRVSIQEPMTVILCISHDTVCAVLLLEWRLLGATASNGDQPKEALTIAKSRRTAPKF